MTRSDTRIDIVLAEKGITRDYQLAEKLNITPSSLSERLSGTISTDTLTKISNALDVTIKDLLK